MKSCCFKKPENHYPTALNPGGSDYAEAKSTCNQHALTMPVLEGSIIHLSGLNSVSSSKLIAIYYQYCKNYLNTHCDAKYIICKELL